MSFPTDLPEPAAQATHATRAPAAHRHTCCCLLCLLVRPSPPLALAPARGREARR